MIKLGEININNSESLIGAQLKLRKILPELEYADIMAIRIEAVTENLFREILSQKGEIKAEFILNDKNDEREFMIRIKMDSPCELPTVSLFDCFQYREEGGEKYLELGTEIDTFTRISETKIEKIRRIFDIKTREELINELNTKNQQLSKSEGFLESLLSNIKSAIYTKNLDGKYIYINSECEELVQKSRKEVIGKSDQELFDIDTSKELTKNDSIVIDNRENITTEDRIVNEDGEELYFLTTKVPMSEDDKIVGLCGISIDISERKKMEEELITAKMVAEEASKAKANFLANMSHEIRTPMNAIMGMSYLMQKTDLTEKQRNYLDKICKSSQHLLAIINDILDFSKIEAGKLEIEKTKFKLSDVLDNLSTLVGQKCSEKNLELLFDIEKGLANSYLGDPLRLGQILVNFTNNAVKFTDRGQIIIRIRKLSTNEHSEILKFEVEDSGIGIRKEQIPNLFKSFQQADTSTTRRYGGTGLGLSISKKLAELMNGEVGVKSEYGKGSIFWFTAELVNDEHLTVMNLIEDDSKEYRVLIVDDNENAREVLKEMLSYMGFIVETAVSGEVAIDKVQDFIKNEKPFDVIYMDFQLIGANGIETFKTIKKLAQDKSPKGIMVTNFGREEIILDAKKNGFEIVLVKPVNPVVLYESTIDVLGIKTKVETGKEKINVKYKKEKMENIQVLLVEDNELNQEVAKEIIESFGCLVEIAGNGKEAIDKISTKEYDIIFMDMQMPVMDGIEATRVIREEFKETKIPIIAMTANAMEADKERSKAAGMNDHLSKPIDPDKLFEVIKKWSKKTKHLDKDISKRECEISELLSIEGLDVKSGCDRVMGKKEKYINLLKRFIDKEEDCVNQIRDQVLRKDYERAKYLAHAFKGVTGNIGATKIYDDVIELESFLKNKDDEDKIFKSISKLALDFGNLSLELKEALGKMRKEDIKKEIGSYEYMSELILKYAEFINKKKTRECRVFAEKCKLYEWPKDIADDIENLSNMLVRYRYKEAEALCNIIMGNIEEAKNGKSSN